MLLGICDALLQLKCMQLNWLLLHCGTENKSSLLKTVTGLPVNTSESGTLWFMLDIN